MLEKVEEYIKKHSVEIISCFIFGALCHGYALTNTIYNYDNYGIQPKGYGSAVYLGRWFLQILGDCVDKLGGNYNLSFFNGIISLALLTLSVCILNDLFELNRVFRILFSGLFVAFPAVTSTFFFMFTAPYYCFSILLAVLSGYFIQKKGVFCKIISIVCITLSIGIYQAYLPMVASLFVLILIKIAIKDDCKVVELFKMAGIYFLSLLFGFVLYVICMKLSLVVYDVQLSTYVGIDQMGKISAGDVIFGIIDSIKNYYMLPIKDYYGVSYSVVTKVGLFFIIFSSCLSLLFLEKYKKLRKDSIFKAILLCFSILVIFPVSIMSYAIVFRNTRIYTIMIFGVVLIFLLPSFIFSINNENKMIKKIGSILTFGLSLVLFSYVYISNVNYVALSNVNAQTENYYQTMITQIKSLDGYNPQMDIALIGNKIDDPSVINPWSEEAIYGGNSSNLINMYDLAKMSMIRSRLGYDFKIIRNSETLDELSQIEEVQNMPEYPCAGSMIIIDDTVIIKISE